MLGFGGRARVIFLIDEHLRQEHARVGQGRIRLQALADRLHHAGSAVEIEHARLGQEGARMRRVALQGGLHRGRRVLPVVLLEE